MRNRIPGGLALVLCLTASCGGGNATSSESAPVATVTVAGSTGALTPGQTVQLTATLRDGQGTALSGRAIGWSTSSASVASVNDGLVTAITAGSATITASSEGKSAALTITVNAAVPVPVASIAIAGGGGSLAPAGTLTLVATVRDAGGHLLTGRTISWLSSANGIASVSATGVVTANASGTATITASSEGKTASVVITVTPAPVATVAIVAPKTAFEVGDAAVTYSTTVKDAQGNLLAGRSVTWGVAPTGVISLSASGSVTAIAPGTATITATSEGILGSVQVTVVPNSAASLLEQRVLAQQGLAIALASTVLQTQIYTLVSVNGADPQICQALPGGGAMRIPAGADQVPAVISFFFDGACTRPYMVETVTQNTVVGTSYHLIANAVYTGPTGTLLGSIAFDETANNITWANNSLTGAVSGLGVYTSPSGAPSVQLGLNCDFGASGHNIGVCQGGIAQNFPGLNTALGSIATLSLDSTTAGVLSFTGGSALRSGAQDQLTLTQPAPTTMLVTGGTPYGTATGTGGAASFALFPPTPTGWTVTDLANDMVFTINLVDNATRTLTATLKRVSSGVTVASLALDQSGTGTITYSNGLVAAVTSWMLSQ